MSERIILNLGPYYVQNRNICYKGNKLYKPAKGIAQIKTPDLEFRHIEIRKDIDKWAALVKIWDGVYKACNAFMTKNHVLLFDLPITTRMISSPGALSGTIISDVDPFEIKFFDNQTFLTQSSQLWSFMFYPPSSLIQGSKEKGLHLSLIA